MERGPEQSRHSNREAAPVLMPPNAEEKLRTMFIYDIPDSVGGDDGIQKLMGSIGGLKRWDSLSSVMDDHKGTKFGFALFDDVEALHIAARLFLEEDVLVPVKKQPGTAEQPDDETFDDFEKAKLNVSLDASSLNYLESFRENDTADDGVAYARAQLKRAVKTFFYPAQDAQVDREGDRSMTNNENGANVEVVNISLAQDDELSDIPAEMREIVAGEIAAFRERSNQRDLERLREEEGFEEMERQRNGASRPSRMDTSAENNIPLGPRGNVPTGPKGQNGVSRGFVNGGMEAGHVSIKEEDDTDASDDELNRRQLAAEKAESDKLYSEAERKWANRERSRQAALERERDREQHGTEMHERRVKEQLERDKAWDDEREASKKSHLYYRDHSNWARKRAMDRADEEARDEGDRRLENDEIRREQAQMEHARGMADSFLDKQSEEMERREAAAAEAAAPQPFKLSLGAAAQKAQASRSAGQRRTIAEVEGLLDDEEAESSTRRQLIPIEYDSTTASAGMSEEEISQAVRKLAQEIPSDKDGLWSWQVKWDYMDDSVIAEKLQPFVEKKIVEYLGVQEEMLVEAVEEHLRKHGDAAALVEELEGVSYYAVTFYETVEQCANHFGIGS
jgi:hypothetical protein